MEALQRANLRVSVALWAVLSEYGDWRLVVSDPYLDTLGIKEAYLALHDALASAGIETEQTPTVMILPASDAFIRSLRRVFGRTKNAEGMRLGGQMIGDRFVEDAYVYRIS